jgi:hypothetical protein
MALTVLHYGHLQLSLGAKLFRWRADSDPKGRTAFKEAFRRADYRRASLKYARLDPFLPGSN